MNRHLFSSAKKVRDAGEIAFGILVFGILIFVFSLFAGAVVSAFFPKEQWRIATGIATGVFWVAGMIPLLIHYKKAAREWPTERRGDKMLSLVEFLSAAAKLVADRALPHQPNDDAFSALKLYLSFFVLLLAGSHMLTYLLLWYKPRLKEITLWLGIAIVFLLENFHS